MPFEELARTLNSLLEPTEGEYRLHAPPVSGTIEVESPGIRQRERIHERESSRIERSVTRSPTTVTPAPLVHTSISPIVREPSTISRQNISNIRVSPLRTPESRTHTPSMAPLPTMRVMTPNAPTPYSVTRLYPEISEFFSASGTGRRAVDQSPETVRGKTIEEIFAQDRQQTQETPTVQHNVSTTIDQPQVQASSLQI